MLEQLAELETGMHQVPSEARRHRARLHPRQSFQPQQTGAAADSQTPRPDNDLNEKIGMYIQRAMADEEAMIFAFGEPWGPEANKRDNYFGFLPGRGIHDIHMNQGNPPGRFARDNGPWQDGGLVFQFPGQNQWVAVFLKFATQAWHTDDGTADALDLAGSGPPSDAAARSRRHHPRGPRSPGPRWSGAHRRGPRERCPHAGAGDGDAAEHVTPGRQPRELGAGGPDEGQDIAVRHDPRRWDGARSRSSHP